MHLTTSDWTAGKAVKEMAMEEVRGKHETHLLAETLAGLSLLALVMFGAGMTVYRVIAPGGWAAQLLGRSLSSGAAALVSLIVIGVLAWFSRDWITPQQKNRYAELMLYAFAGAGILYVVQLWLIGAL
jgi:cation transporter-like permease